MSHGLSTVRGRRALKFESREGFTWCIRHYTETHPDAYFGSAGNYTAIVSSEFFDEVTTAHEAEGIEFNEVELRSMGDLPPEEAAALRRTRGFRGTAADRTKILEELRAKYGS